MRYFEIRNSGRAVRPRACGEGCRTLIIASIGSSQPDDPLETEMQKALAAQEVGADVVTDHSFYGDIPGLHKALCEQLGILVSAVSCYELAARVPHVNVRSAPGDLPLDILHEQVHRGLDMVTVHAGLRRSHLDLVHDSRRLIPMTSKGGAIVSAWMRCRDEENPYYARFDTVLNICRERDVTLSLGTSFRCATVCDHWDRLLSAELETMSELVARAVDRGVKVMVEGLGHAALDEIPLYVRTTKLACQGVPYRVLPMCTDIALGFDHISGAIAGATAVASGADAITCMSRAEHIGLPSIDDLKEAVIAARVAAHSGELVKLRDFARDEQMSRTRWEHGCRGDWTVAVYPEGARAALEARGRLDAQVVQCSMCGAYCGIAGGNAAARLAPQSGGR